MKACLNSPSHMNKMAAMPIHGKNLKNLLPSGIERPMTLKLVIQH